MRSGYFAISCAMILVLLAGSSVYAYAGERRFKASELTVLPKFCQDKEAGRNSKRWLGVFGKDWANMHHLCYAYVYHNRAKKVFGESPIDRQERGGLVAIAQSNYMYMINHATSENFVLLPHIYVRLGQLLEKDNPSSALESYAKAIDLKKDYVQAYIALSDFYKKNNDLNKAKEMLEAGLALSPKSKKLKRRLRRLEAKM